jgi:hypothetical protein
MRSIQLFRWRQLAAVLGVVAIVVAGCGGDDGSKGAAGDTTTTAKDSSTTSTAPAAGHGEVDAAFCAALSADLDAIDAIDKSFESSGSASAALVQDGQHANDALRTATPDGLSDEAGAIYGPLGKLLDKLAAGDTANIGSEYAAAVGSPDFTGPLGTLTRQCAALATAG